MERQPTNVQTATITELNTLLNQLDWDAQQASYLEGERVNLLLDPMPSEIPQHVHVPLTIIALGAQPAVLTGARIELQQVGNATLHYGHLSQRGQLLLRNLPLGTYQIKAHTARESVQTVQRLGAISAQTKQTLAQVLDMVALPAYDPRPDSAQLWQLIYHDDDGIFTTSIQRQSAERFNITFESPNRQWDGALLAFTWQAPYARLSQRSEPLLRFAVMRWDASKRLCITEFNCNAAALPIEIGLPVKAYPPAQLSDELAEILLLSIQAAVTEQARQGWRTLFDSAQLPTTVAPIIQSALTPTPVSLWRAIGETLVEFAQELQIQVSEHVAQFIQLPVTLTPQLVVAADKFKGVGDAPTQRQTLTLSLPESDLALTFMPSTAGEDRTTTLGVALVQSSSAQPIGRAYITLRDDEQRTLEGGLTSSDGRIDFSDLLPGVYYVEVNYQNKVMRVGIRVTHSPAGVETRAINPTNVL